jgi:hypothetical protein
MKTTMQNSKSLVDEKFARAKGIRWKGEELYFDDYYVGYIKNKIFFAYKTYKGFYRIYKSFTFKKEILKELERLCVEKLIIRHRVVTSYDALDTEDYFVSRSESADKDAGCDVYEISFYDLVNKGWVMGDELYIERDKMKELKIVKKHGV